MSQLILVVLAIALTAGMVLVSVQYVPAWTKDSALLESSVRRDLSRLEQAYDIATRAADGVEPAVVASETDGGFASIFRPILTFVPSAPPGASWVYGQHATDGGNYSQLHYFCLTVPAGEKGTWRALNRAHATFSHEQVFVNSGCDIPAEGTAPADYPAVMAITMYVSFVPGIDK